MPETTDPTFYRTPRAGLARLLRPSRERTEG